ncbi:MAG TPA: hypothetical protein VM029_06305 [Opitutaceae bacterium]|nr:hypothetical protein [Opitutaceae bacterium]
MRTLLLLWLTAAVACAAERSVEARGLNAKTFAEDGRLLRHLTAESASGPFTAPTIQHGKVEFYAREPADRGAAVLQWTEAKYLRAEETIVGNEAIALRTDEANVSGWGFRCALEAGRLELKSDVRFSSPTFRMSGREALVLFDAKGSKTAVIRSIEVTGDIVMERTPTLKAPFERAESSFARFSAEENKVFLKSPVAAWRKGERMMLEVASGFVEIDLGETADPK